MRAPELLGRRWLNTGGAAVRLADLRGKVAVLDFWTFCCVNCLHVLDELRPLEREFADQLVLIGVHSPKFEHEADPVALEQAVERYAVHHPVLDDPELQTWGAYTARAWPTLVVIDPEGYVVGQFSGEGHSHGLEVLIRELLEEHRAKGTLRTGDGPYVAPEAPTTALRFPGKLAAVGDGSYLVSDTAHHQVVQLEADLETERARYGDGHLDSPHGVLVLPPDAARRLGYDALVADTVRHQVFSIRFSDGEIRVQAGTGEQLRERSGSGAALGQPLSTPWDLAWWIDRVVIAMAGTHQLWALHLAADPKDNSVAVLAGTSQEGLRDGDAHGAWLAQPSGLAASADGKKVWIADSETSALRSISLQDTGFRLDSYVGKGLFDFGHLDGPASEALLQHPLGVAELPDGSVAIADTYNGAIRRYDPAAGEVSTLATDLAEPSDLLVEDDPAGARLVVVESAAHRVVRVAIPVAAARVSGPALQTQRPVTRVTPGALRLSVDFVPPTGQKLDKRYGDPTQLTVSASPEGLLRNGAGAAQGLERTLELADDITEGVLHISVRAAACDGDPITGELPEHAACHVYQQDWGIPVSLVADGADRLELALRGTSAS
ncbi:thiol-disulfide isomerase/thioredoxin/sugar lactone lactonase YvrE [Flexivirga oryzae]|uniref:Thiol-disulfide isomerase/thioredoxin/sugar lactone lactonase YvrE n=1 Tax=Flexivirga oryzae TaxID=1794944 RepID=A0A839NEE8_9MICO|nr:thiol-disulfide isomerase/thioredoxin/sugar lactone lactonase YvrE [Flexivirga oryzae]